MFPFSGSTIPQGPVSSASMPLIGIFGGAFHQAVIAAILVVSGGRDMGVLLSCRAESHANKCHHGVWCCVLSWYGSAVTVTQRISPCLRYRIHYVGRRRWFGDSILLLLWTACVDRSLDSL